MTIGVAFAVICLVGITVILVWEATVAFAFHSSSFWLKDISLHCFLGTSELVSNFSISVMDFAVIVFSTVLSVTVHELGHAVAAASLCLSFIPAAIHITSSLYLWFWEFPRYLLCLGIYLEGVLYWTIRRGIVSQQVARREKIYQDARDGSLLHHLPNLEEETKGCEDFPDFWNCAFCHYLLKNCLRNCASCYLSARLSSNLFLQRMLFLIALRIYTDYGLLQQELSYPHFDAF
ncbi:hypothetical protein HPP92_009723 [Vanilla planifolia]|uniref:Uncharacterized protein n=1 Tax=Vanilla planifolia TaxID=51239 RepID=A0A835V7P6_VANPL|nr:hypothetical protein HPP92_009723 [Vanilla planifolia]